MSKQTINIGASPNDGTGTPLRTSFDYTNQNFTEIYTALGGGVALPGATTQVIFNDGGTNLAGDAGLVYNKTTDALTVAGLVTAGSATITGDLTVDTSTLKVDSTNDRVGIGTASPAAAAKLSVLGTTVVSASDFVNASTWSARFQAAANSQPSGIFLSGLASGGQVVPGSLHVEPVAASSRSALIATYSADSGVGYFAINRFSPSAGTTSEHYKIDNAGVATWSNVGGVAGTAMTLNSTGLGIGDAPASGEKLTVLGSIYLKTANKLKLDNASNNFGASIHNIGASAQAALAFTLGATQAMTLDANGTLLVGKTASSATTVGVQLESVGSVVSTLAASTSATNTLIVYSTGAAAYRFYVGLGGTVNATNATISAISDARFKENVQDIDVGLNAILSLKPRKFDWKAGKGKDIKGDRGFIAQEFETVFPNLIDEWKDPAPEGEAPYKSVRQDLIPVLVKAIQELTARVQTLEAR